MADDAPITLPTGTRVLHMGDSGPDVRALQAALNASGASPALTVDGAYGVGTRAAVGCADVNGPAAGPDGLGSAPFTAWFSTYYQTDPISRASPTMAACVQTYAAPALAAAE